MKMKGLIVLLICGAVSPMCRAEETAVSILEKFLTTGLNKGAAEEIQEKEVTAGATENELVQFMKRAGLMGTGPADNNQQTLLNSLQSYSPQQSTMYYVPQQSQLTNYVAPKRQLDVSQQQQQQQQQSSSLSSNAIPINTISKIKNAAAAESEQDGSSKKITKADRQGLYIQDGLYDNGNHGGYAGNVNGYPDHGGHIDAKDGYSGGYEGYSGAHYSPEPIHKPVYAPSVAIKIDPIGILRLLLQGIPRPLLNLNGKVFFGVELGKNAGLKIGVPPKAHGGYRTPHGGGTVLTLG